MSDSSKHGKPGSTYEGAKAIVAAGLSIVPIRRDGSKQPDFALRPRVWDDNDAKYKVTWNPLAEALPTPEQVEQWFGGLNPAGIAIIGGRVSGNLEQLDFDTDADRIF